MKFYWSLFAFASWAQAEEKGNLRRLAVKLPTCESIVQNTPAACEARHEERIALDAVAGQEEPCVWDPWGNDCHTHTSKHIGEEFVLDDEGHLEVTKPANGEIGGFCSVRYENKTWADGRKWRNEYTPVQACYDPNYPGTLMCSAVGDSGAPSPSEFNGVCEPELCHGKAKPGISEGDEDETNEASIRVTICHRTCSATNPWVRITVDDDAWNGTAASGCGHKLQHNVSIDCKQTILTRMGNPDTYLPEAFAQARNEIWGPNDADYLIKWHGTRQYVRTVNNWAPPVCTNSRCNKYTDEEKAYWFGWERACPYVRHGDCCGTVEIGACCGPDPYPGINAAISIEKMAGPDLSPVTCPKNDQMKETHLAPSGTWATYSYKITNTGSTYLCGIMFEDPEIAYPVQEYQVTYDSSELDFRGIMQNGCLPPGASTFARCNSFPLMQNEKKMAHVKATPSYPDGQPIDPVLLPYVEDEDDAEVVPYKPTDVPKIPCPDNMQSNGSPDVCAGAPVVEFIAAESRLGSMKLEDLGVTDPTKVFYNLNLQNDVVTFRYDNPFIFTLDMYVEYREPPFDPACHKSINMDECANPDQTPVTAKCIVGGTAQPFTMVNVYFVSTDAKLNFISNSPDPYECCHREEDGNIGHAIYKLAFKILCSCPMEETQ